MIKYILCALLGYFAGCFSPSYLLSRRRGFDIRTFGSGNAGATNVLRSQGKLPAILTTVGDLAKSFAAVLLGGLGGRLEHTLGNLQLLDWLSTQGAVGFLAGEKTVVTALRDSSLAFPPSMSGYLSVLCSSGTAHGVTLSHLKYPLTGYDMTSSFPIGVSNEFLPDQPAAVSVKDGCLLLIWEDKGDFYLRLPKLWGRNEAL